MAVHDETPRPVDIRDMTDAEVLAAIFDRYHGRMDSLDFSTPDIRAQLALDLGMLIGLGFRLIDAMKPLRIAQLTTALDESVKLQSHYAQLLNSHDGGQRRTFRTASAWIARLRETNTL